MMNSEELFKMIGYADEQYIKEAGNIRKTNSILLKKCIAAVMIVVGISGSLTAVSRENFGIMGGTAGGSMYYHEESNDLYYGGKNGDIYAYDADTDSVECVIEGADKFFGVKDGCIYYTSKENSYIYKISSADFCETEDFAEETELLYSDAYYNSEEIKNILNKNEEVNGDAPYALLGDDRIYVAHNMCGGYLSVYEIENGVIEIESEQILENTYTIWQTLMTGIGTLNLGTLAINMLFIVIIPAVLIVGGILILIRVRMVK